jgi:hypothetical protein
VVVDRARQSFARICGRKLDAEYARLRRDEAERLRALRERWQNEGY